MAKKIKKQKADSLPLVAIDLGSDSVRAMAAEYVGDDLFRVLGVEQSRKHPCIEQGIITNSTNAAFMIGEVLKLLANRINVPELPTAFVSVGGQSMQIVAVKARRDQVRKREIARAILDDMEAECKQKIENRNPDVAVLGLVPSYFVLDGVEQDEVPTPEQRAVIIEAHYIAFYGRKAMDTQLVKSFNQAGRSIERAFVRPETLLSLFAAVDGNRLLSDGCAVLDMGAQTTTLTVFKGGQYLLNKVVAKGGYHVTRLLEQQGMTLAMAEVLKKKYGVASPEDMEKNLRLRLPTASGEDEMVVSTGELATMISSKLQEILEPLMAELARINEQHAIPYLYITGGASMLAGMQPYLQRQTTSQVRYGAHDMLLTADTDEQYLCPIWSSLVGTLLLGQDYRETHKDRLVEQPPSLLDRIKNQTLDIFRDQDYEL